MVQAFITIYNRDLSKLKEEISAYPDEASIWKVAPGINNSAGNLVLHTLGSINHFVGAVLGNTGYVRKRDEEFTKKDIPRSQLIADIENTITMLKTVVGSLSDADLEKDFPGKFGENVVKTGFILVQMGTHIDYHLGQINYHRRLLNA